MTTQQTPLIKDFFDPETWTFTYVVYAGEGSACVVIDSVLNYDSKSGRTTTKSADSVVQFITEKKLQFMTLRPVR